MPTTLADSLDYIVNKFEHDQGWTGVAVWSVQRLG